VDYRILGSFEIYDDGALLAPGTGRQRALLALLLLRANETVQSETLVDELWEGSPPPSATKILQNYVSRLRRGLGDGVLVTRGHGYALRVGPGEVDVDRFRQQLEVGRRALASNEPELATETLSAALALWRGPPLVDFADERFARSDIERLEELRLAALTERIEADLALGRHVELIGELEALAGRYPFHERLCAQRMLALYRSGRQAEALEAYREMRHALVEQLGIEPGASLQALERSILTHDPSLELRPRSTVVPRAGRNRSRRGRRALAVGIVAAAMVAGVAVGLVGLAQRESEEVVDPGRSVGMLDPGSNTVTGRTPVGLLPVAIAAGAGHVWVLNLGETTVSKIDARTGRVTRTIGLSEKNVAGATAIAFGFGAAWVGNGNAGTVTRIGANSFGAEPPIRVRALDTSDVLHVATGDGAVWVVSTRHASVYRIDPVTWRVSAGVTAPSIPAGVAAGDGAVWVVSVRPTQTSGTLARIDPSTRAVASVLSLPFAPSAVTVGFGAVWVTLNAQDAVLRIDPRANTVERTIEVGDGPTAIAAGSDAIWVVNAKGHTISRIDPETNDVVATIPVTGTPGAITSAGRIWVTGV
jgi:DNA-binding SARP family transcriptional activator